MKYNKDGNNLVIYLEGRITSENAHDLEQECFDTIEEIFPNGRYECGIELDCNGLEMVSSAGLRVILKLKKKYGDVKVTNVLPDVYEIFEITGFAEMMTVERAYHQVSIDGLPVIATGAVGTVYEYDEDTIIKVFRQDTPIEILKQEQEMAKKAFVVGVSTAIQQGVVKVGDSYGILFEYLRDDSVGDLIGKDPDNLEMYVSKFVEALKNMNGIDCSGMNLLSVKDTYVRAIDNREKVFGREKADKLRRWLELFPDGNSFIHGDFHPRNMK
ncbi:MAG: STAS domain-containing protein, partial [Parasporobacterium sp.]|nr:STAS domain-containing protein [Parasporobacterium sp.]